MTDEADRPPLITFGEAEAIGHALHDHWEKMGATPPLDRQDMAWGDIVQFVLRKASEAVLAREGEQ